jgi:hypothetical protein
MENDPRDRPLQAPRVGNAASAEHAPYLLPGAVRADGPVGYGVPGGATARGDPAQADEARGHTIAMGTVRGVTPSLGRTVTLSPARASVRSVKVT